MRRLLLVLTLLVACASEEAYLPHYPGARYMNDRQMSFTVDQPKNKLVVAMFDTPDDISEVAAFYEGQLAGRSEFKGGWTRGSEFGEWTDGNVRGVGRSGNKWEAVDPSRPGGYLFLAKKEGGCMIQIVTSTPK